MFGIPPLPPWSALHPLVVHFPIALLLVAPLFAASALALPRRKAYGAAVVAFILVLLGTVSLFVAVETGEATAEQVTKTPEIKALLHDHEELAETSEAIFGSLAVLFGGLLLGPKLFHKELTARTFRTAMSILLIAYLGGILSLVNTAHAGGRLVHEFGVTAGQRATSAASLNANPQESQQASRLGQNPAADR